jgi:hypothetical protein
MAILTFDQLKAAPNDRIKMKRTASVAAVAAQPTTVWQAAGFPGAGTLAIGNTTSGIKPVAGQTGYPPIKAFPGGAKGEISRLVFSNTVAGVTELFDALWAGGAFPFNANQPITTPPSYSDRVPGGNDYNNLIIHVEAVTAFTGNPSFTIQYTRGDGTTGRSTGVVASGAALGVGRGLFLPLQAGDNSVQAITNVQCTVATAGTFNVRVLRSLGEARGDTANWQDVQDWFRTGGPEVFDTSALYPLVTPDSTATGLPSITVDIRNG